MACEEKILKTVKDAVFWWCNVVWWLRWPKTIYSLSLIIVLLELLDTFWTIVNYKRIKYCAGNCGQTIQTDDVADSHKMCCEMKMWFCADVWQTKWFAQYTSRSYVEAQSVVHLWGSEVWCGLIPATERSRKARTRHGWCPYYTLAMLRANANKYVLLKIFCKGQRKAVNFSFLGSYLGTNRRSLKWIIL